jgi:type IV pilus assembly protein PilM
MSFFLPEFSAIGIHGSGEAFTTAHCTLKGGEITVISTDTALPSEGTFSSDAIIATGLSACDVLVRSLSLEVSRRKDAEAVLGYQLEPMIPFPLEEAIYDSVLCPREGNNYDVTSFVARGTALEDHLTSYRERDIAPDVVACEQAALYAFARHTAGDASSIIVVHTTATYSLILHISEGKLLSSHLLDKGYSPLLKSFCRERNLEAAEGYKELTELFWGKNALPRYFDEDIHAFDKEVAKTVKALLPNNKNASPPTVITTGFPFTALTSLASFSHTPISYDHTMAAVAIGLALNALTTDAITFRKGVFSSPTPWKKLSKHLFTSAALYCSLFLVTTMICYNLYAYKYSHVEEKYQTTRALFDDTPDSARPLATKVYSLEHHASTLADMPALSSNTPKVSDLLSWIDSLSFLGEEENRHGGQVFFLDKVSYNTTTSSYTDMTSPHQVKVDLEFRTATPSCARSFRDALTQPNNIIDNDAPITWNVVEETYATSFFLKTEEQL